MLINIDLKALTVESHLRGRARALLGGACTRCGRSEGLPLDIHHVNGDGGAHRSSFLGDRIAYYEDIIRKIEGGSREFEVLCRDCHNLEHDREASHA